MRDKVMKKLDDLTAEAEGLANERESYFKHIRDIDTRLTQLVGAIAELHSLLNEPLDNQASPQGSGPQSPEYVGS